MEISPARRVPAARTGSDAAWYSQAVSLIGSITQQNGTPQAWYSSHLRRIQPSRSSGDIISSIAGPARLGAGFRSRRSDDIRNKVLSWRQLDRYFGNCLHT